MRKKHLHTKWCVCEICIAVGGVEKALDAADDLRFDDRVKEIEQLRKEFTRDLLDATEQQHPFEFKYEEDE